MIKHNPKISVVIPTYNREEVLINVVKDLFDQHYLNYEIIIVDQSEKIPQKLFKFIKGNSKIQYIREKEIGSPNARNVGVKQAKGKIIIFLDDDIRINNKNFIQNHENNFLQKDIGMVGGRVIEADYPKIKTRKEVGKLKYFGLKSISNFDADFRAEIDHAPGGNSSVLKSIFDKIGGFKNIYRGNAHLEETDFSLRVKRAGYKIIFDPKPEIIHLKYKSGGNRVKDVYNLRYWICHNYIIFILENYNKLLVIILAIRQFIWAGLAYIKRGFDAKMFCSIFGGTINGFKTWKELKNE